jgi:hypothetical protein
MDSVSGLHGEALEAESADHRRSREAESGASTGTKSYRNQAGTGQYMANKLLQEILETSRKTAESSDVQVQARTCSSKLVM